MNRKFGPITQNAFVIRDLDAAVDHWARNVGVGPFLVLEHLDHQERYYKGEPTEYDISVALSYSGDLMIELIEQHNQAPSIYLDFLEQFPVGGLQHLGCADADLAALLADPQVAPPVQWGRSGRSQFAYFDTGPFPGTMVEVSAPANDRSASQVDESGSWDLTPLRQAAASWDGKDAIFKL